MENPKNNTRPSQFVLFSLESVQESLRGVSSRTPLCETGFWLPFQIETWLAPRLLPRPLPWRLSAPLFMWILLKANLGLGSLQSSLPRPVDQFLKSTQGNPAPLFGIKLDLMPQEVLRRVLLRFFLFSTAFSM